MMPRFLTFTLALVLAVYATAAHAQTASVSPVDRQYASSVAKACLGNNWQNQNCLAAVSQSNTVLAANYGSALQQGGHPNEAEQIKQHCAASTAAANGTFPAYALRSADTECANTIADISGSTQMTPDANLYQLLIGATLCLSGDSRCSAIEQGLQPYASAQ